MWKCSGKWWWILPAALLLITLMGCSDDEPYQFGEFRYDMVTFRGLQGGTAHFDLVERDDAGVKHLSATVDTVNIKEGRRVMLNYTSLNPDDENQTVQLKGMLAIITDSLRAAHPDTVAVRKKEQVKLGSVWRTGDYINLQCEVELTDNARQFYLLADKQTLTADTVHCYLVHNTWDKPTYYWRNCYASFYVGAAWHRSTCRVIRVHLNDVTYPDKKFYDFSKK